MNILIDKAGFDNKGGELMFCSIVEKLEQQYPEAQLLTSEWVIRSDGYEYCQEHNIRYVKTGLWARLTYPIIAKAIRKKRLRAKIERIFIPSSKVDVIIDAGGFRFGDQWRYRATSAKTIKRYYKSFNSKCKLIFMPQSFGPFTEKYSILTAKIALKNASLAFAREHLSYDYLKEIAHDKLHIEFKRDFTILHSNHDLANMLVKGEFVVVVPNKKMITHSGLGEGVYFNFICELVRALKAKGEKVVLLNHECIGDKQLCEQIKQELGFDIPILSNLRAMQVKNIISSAKLLVSSRFHGVVSGLVSQVPTFCTSWSHKYNELLATYELEGNLLDMTSLDDSLAKLADALSNPEKYIAKTAIIEREKESIEQMWTKIFRFIDSGVIN